jgi:hypothetical protein
MMHPGQLPLREEPSQSLPPQEGTGCAVEARYLQCI